MKYIVPIIALLASPVAAVEYGPGENDITNPDEMTWQKFLERAERGESDMVLCSMGYAMTKSGDHSTARTLFESCAAAGFTGTMTWMSYMENNGFGGEYNPDASAEWDRRAAELGDPVGKFNHGINLMRGYGIRQDAELGRRFVDEAAREGLVVAQRLQRAEYDLDEVTPDADNWRYAPAF